MSSPDFPPQYLNPTVEGVQSPHSDGGCPGEQLFEAVCGTTSPHAPQSYSCCLSSSMATLQNFTTARQIYEKQYVGAIVLQAIHISIEATCVSCCNSMIKCRLLMEGNQQKCSMSVDCSTEFPSWAMLSKNQLGRESFFFLSFLLYLPFQSDCHGGA